MMLRGKRANIENAAETPPYKAGKMKHEFVSATSELILKGSDLILQIPNNTVSLIVARLEDIWHATGVDGHQPFFDFPTHQPAQGSPNHTIVTLPACHDINEVLAVLADVEIITTQQAQAVSPTFNPEPQQTFNSNSAGAKQ